MRKTCFSVVALVLSGIVALPALAETPASSRSLITAPLCASAPVIDGHLSDPAWERAGGAAMLESAEQLCHSFKVCRDEQNVYFAVYCPEPKMETIVAPNGDRDAAVFSHESIELFISPQDGFGKYFQLMLSAANVQADTFYAIPANGDGSWNGKWDSATSLGKDGWQAEIAIPFATLGVQAPKLGERWGLNVCRNRVNLDKTYRVWNSWSALLSGGAGNFHSPDKFGILRFGDYEAVTVGKLCDLFPGRHNTRLTVWGSNAAQVIIRSGDGKSETVTNAKAAPGRPATISWTQRATDTAISAEIRDTKTNEILYNTGPLAGSNLKATPYWRMAKSVDPSGKLLTAVQSSLKQIEGSAEPYSARKARWQTALADLETQARTLQARKLLACGPKDALGKPAYGVGLASGMVKVLPEHPELAQLEFNRSINMQAAKREMEAKQVILFSPDKPLRNVALTITDLISRDGSTIPAGAITAASMGFVNCKKPFYEVDVTGWYPDPILTDLKQFDVRRGDLHSIWYSVRVPADAKAGAYQGNLTISPEGEPAAVLPVRLQVWDFTLPLVPSLPTALSTRTELAYQLAAGKDGVSYGRAQQLVREYDKFLLEHRCSPGYGIYRPNQWIEQDSMKQWAEMGVSAFTIFAVRNEEIERCEKEVPPDLQAHFRNMIDRTLQMARELGIEKRAHVYMADELPARYFRAIDNVCAFIEENYPGLLTLTTALDSSFGTKSALKHMRGFCPNTPLYKADLAAEVRRTGKQVWWYIDGGPYTPYANVFTEYPAIGSRLLMGFMAYAYKPDGFLYWSMIYPETNKKLLTGGPYTDWNPEVMGWNGDGHLIYPGPDGPVSTIRMENWLDGLEDYEYCKLLEQRIAQLKSEGKITKARKLSAMLDKYGKTGNEIVGDMTHYTLDPAAVEKARLKLAQAILR